MVRAQVFYTDCDSFSVLCARVHLSIRYGHCEYVEHLICRVYPCICKGCVDPYAIMFANVGCVRFFRVVASITQLTLGLNRLFTVHFGMLRFYRCLVPPQHFYTKKIIYFLFLLFFEISFWFFLCFIYISSYIQFCSLSSRGINAEFRCACICFQ